MGTKLVQLLLQFWTVFVVLKLARSETSDNCNTKYTCNECIQLKDCAWCADPEEKAYRCYNGNKYQPGEKCRVEHIQSVKNNETLIQNLQPTKKGEITGKIVQMQPQAMKLMLRVDSPHSFTIKYTQSADYPVDLYFIMDLSYSMEVHKKKLIELGHTLGTEMRKISKDFHLGFGSFIDKTVLPFVGSPNTYSVQPYGFQNQMSLTSNISAFSKNVEKAKISGNNDTPEGSFDALMQAIVCKKEIGWRDQSRKIIILATDAGFHQALDGKLAGIILPNDGKCHLDSHGSYEYSTIQDYPSISQINRKTKENSMNIIFAVTSNVTKIYKKLIHSISGSYLAELTTDSSNIVRLIKEQYQKISTTIQLNDNAGEGLRIKYESKCLGQGKAKITNKCDNVTLGETVEFNVTVTLTSCPKDANELIQNIIISPVGVDEKLEIGIHMLCSCECETKKATEKSEACKNYGWMVCGLCQCDNEHVGANCECSANFDAYQNGTELSTQCIQDGIICSNRGDCDCGVCQCNDNQITGKYCQCDDRSCDRNGQGLLCSGPNQGVCDCNECKCKEGWEGSDCSCSSSTDTCKNPEGPVDEICSDRGVCHCGICKCDTDVDRYDGAYCEKCPLCSDDCPKLRDCVECQLYKSGKLAKDCMNVCTNFNTTGHVNLTEFENNQDFRMCTFYDENECRFQFVYSDIFGEGLKVHAKNTLECKPKVKLEDVMYISILTIVLVGILTLLLWKVITTIHDRREYAKFLNEKKNWIPIQNPLFQ